MDSLERESTILLVDARPWTREALARGIETACRDFKVVTFADASALAQAGSQDGAAAIMINATGMALTDHRVSDAWATARSCLPGLPIVVLSDSEGSEGVLDAIENGLSGYIPISVELPVLIDALRFVAAGGIFVPAELALLGAAGPSDRDLPSQIRGKPIGDKPPDGSTPHIPISSPLTPREHNVLRWLSQGKSNKQIARELGIREATVKVHVRNMIAKFGAANRTQVALLAAEIAKQVTVPDDSRHQGEGTAPDNLNKDCPDH